MSSIQPESRQFQDLSLGQKGIEIYEGKGAKQALLKGDAVEVTVGGKTYVCNKKDVKKFLEKNSTLSTPFEKIPPKTLGQMVQTVLQSFRKPKKEPDSK